MVNFIFIQMALLLQAIVAVRGENSTNTKCEDGWSDETLVGLGCILADKRAVFNFAQANEYCKAQDSRLIELETELQMKHVSNLLKNVSGDNLNQWWGGAIQVGPEQDRNWTWIQSGAVVQNWTWGAGYPGNNNNETNHFIFQQYQDILSRNRSYHGRDVSKDWYYYPVCQKLSMETTTDSNNNRYN